MDRVEDIFEQEIQGSGDLDVDMANAGHILVKLAEEEGVDLNSLSDEDVASLLGKLLPQTKEAAMADQTETQSETATETENQLTYADVSAELNKIAAAEGVDLTKLDRAEYNEVFSKLAEHMANPAYAAEQEEEEAKLAAAFQQGQHMADGFIARLNEVEAEKEAGSALAKVPQNAAKGALSAAKDKVMHAIHQGKATATAKALRAQRAGKRHLAEHGSKYMAGAAGGVGVGAGYAAGHSKKEAAALELARQYIIESGYNPDTGEKVASSEDDEIALRAAEMLREAGYLAGE